MRLFLANKDGMKRMTFNLVDWEDLDKMMVNSSQQFGIWVTK